MLSKLITRRGLADLASEEVFGRGEEYFSCGAVERLRASEDKVTARVTGSARYQVELWPDEDELAYHCTCPHAADGYFCKHCVAVGLTWLAGQGSEGRSTAKSRKKRQDPWRDIRAYLTTQPAETMIDLLLEVAQRDDQLYRTLLLQADRTGGRDVAEAFRRAIDDVTDIHGFVDWREASTYAANVDSVVDSLAELLHPDAAATLVELAEYAMERLERSLEQIDDSDGEIGGVVCRLGELHLKACTMARPEPARLAERLFELETTSPYGLCSFSAATYARPLGKEGLRRYRELAQAEWRTVQPRESDGPYDARRSCITRIMEQLAAASGDVEELVAIKARDLSSGHSYLDIAEIWAKAGQHDTALEWAERGLKAFAERTDNRLRDFLVAAYLKRKRTDEALQASALTKHCN